MGLSPQQASPFLQFFYPSLSLQSFAPTSVPLPSILLSVPLSWVFRPNKRPPSFNSSIRPRSRVFRPDEHPPSFNSSICPSLSGLLPQRASLFLQFFYPSLSLRSFVPTSVPLPSILLSVPLSWVFRPNERPPSFNSSIRPSLSGLSPQRAPPFLQFFYPSLSLGSFAPTSVPLPSILLSVPLSPVFRPNERPPFLQFFYPSLSLGSFAPTSAPLPSILLSVPLSPVFRPNERPPSFNSSIRPSLLGLSPQRASPFLQFFYPSLSLRSFAPSTKCR